MLKNKTLALDAVVAQTAYVESPGHRGGQSTMEVMTEEGILIYEVSALYAIACWNIKTPFTIENHHIVDYVSIISFTLLQTIRLTIFFSYIFTSLY